MKILILEDHLAIQRLWVAEFEDDGIEVLGAFSICEAEDLFGAHSSNIDLIAVDACVPGHNINTAPFVKKARARGYRGPMVAMSSFKEFRCQLVDAGCDYQCEKDFLVSKVRDILAVSQPVAV